jgi:hypothetical protein
LNDPHKFNKIAISTTEESQTTPTKEINIEDGIDFPLEDGIDFTLVLPYDVIMVVLSFLDFESLAMIARTNSQLHKFAMHPSLWINFEGMPSHYFIVIVINLVEYLWKNFNGLWCEFWQGNH